MTCLPQSSPLEKETDRQTDRDRQTETERHRHRDTEIETERGRGEGWGGEEPETEYAQSVCTSKTRATGEECLTNKPEQIFTFSSIALI